MVDPMAAGQENPSESERPSWACLTHRPPRSGQPWVQAHEGYTTCDGCLDRLRGRLREVADRYAVLDARVSPTLAGQAGGGGRSAPGFVSRPAGSVHVMAMRDPRSRCSPVAVDDVQYVWASPAGHGMPLPAGVQGPQPDGAYVARRDVWRGSDGRAHAEAEQPSRSVATVLLSLATLVAEQRGIWPPAIPRLPSTSCPVVWVAGRPRPARPPKPVDFLVRWLDGQLDWITRQTWVVDVADQIGEVLADLRPVTGDPAPVEVGRCRRVLDPDPDAGLPARPCGRRLYAPWHGDTISCRCGASWDRPTWEHLGRMLQEAS